MLEYVKYMKIYEHKLNKLKLNYFVVKINLIVFEIHYLNSLY